MGLFLAFTLNCQVFNVVPIPACGSFSKNNFQTNRFAHCYRTDTHCFGNIATFITQFTYRDPKIPKLSKTTCNDFGIDDRGADAVG